MIFSLWVMKYPNRCKGNLNLQPVPKCTVLHDLFNRKHWAVMFCNLHQYLNWQTLIASKWRDHLLGTKSGSVTLPALTLHDLPPHGWPRDHSCTHEVTEWHTSSHWNPNLERPCSVFCFLTFHNDCLTAWRQPFTDWLAPSAASPTPAGESQSCRATSGEIKFEGRKNDQICDGGGDQMRHFIPPTLTKLLLQRESLASF